MKHPHFLLNRADKLGDVILTLPMAGILKATFPGCKVSLLGQRYTAPLAECCEYIDEVYAWDEIAELPSQAERIARFKAFDADAIIHIYPKSEVARLARQAHIPKRIGTIRRLYHWPNCNRLLYLRRHHSPLHEAQLNIQLLRGVGIERFYELDEIGSYFGLSNIPPLPASIGAYLEAGKFNLIVHPKSAGSSREWPSHYFAQLIESLPPERFNVLVTGSAREGELVRDELPMHLAHVKDLMGRISLAELISLIDAADGLLAVSTGPLHIAAALGKATVGIYVPFRAKHTGRWGPIGPRTRTFQRAGKCTHCPVPKGETDPTNCECMLQITPVQIKAHLTELADAQRDAALCRPSQRSESVANEQFSSTKAKVSG
ncbi:MAG: glycosyltransferase family 9 protein [Salinisphaera sp.]|nr:glycosyltransferase family 9 protein [Salinisphaera sp.]